MVCGYCDKSRRIGIGAPVIDVPRFSAAFAPRDLTGSKEPIPSLRSRDKAPSPSQQRRLATATKNVARPD